MGQVQTTRASRTNQGLGTSQASLPCPAKRACAEHTGTVQLVSLSKMDAVKKGHKQRHNKRRRMPAHKGILFFSSPPPHYYCSQGSLRQEPPSLRSITAPAPSNVLVCQHPGNSAASTLPRTFQTSRAELRGTHFKPQQAQPHFVHDGLERNTQTNHHGFRQGRR
jgi:hypothetical protein